MGDAALLERLCRLHGIATEYEDVWGKRRPASEASLRALLGALGVDVAAAGGASDPAACDAVEWRRALPPVVVLT